MFAIDITPDSKGDGWFKRKVLLYIVCIGFVNKKDIFLFILTYSDVLIVGLKRFDVMETKFVHIALNTN